jgi:ribonuclease T2
LPRAAHVVRAAIRPLRRTAALAIAGLLLAACAPAADEDPFDFYVLALSWSPSYCLLAGGEADEAQCGHNPPEGFVVHGLWPQFEEGWPQYCDTRHGAPGRSTLAEAMEVLPTLGLARHQWEKHGSCSGLSPEAYLEHTRAAYEAIDIPDLPAGGRVSTEKVAAAFRRANPGLDEGGMAVTCQDGALQEVRICLTRELAFRACDEVAERSCKASGLEVPAAD